MDKQPRLKTVWFSDIRDDTAREQFKQNVVGSKIVLDKLHKIVYNMVISGERVPVDDYDSPSWSHKQADRNGYARALREVLEILNFNGDHDK